MIEKSDSVTRFKKGCKKEYYVNYTVSNSHENDV